MRILAKIFAELQYASIGSIGQYSPTEDEN